MKNNVKTFFSEYSFEIVSFTMTIIIVLLILGFGFGFGYTYNDKRSINNIVGWETYDTGDKVGLELQFENGAIYTLEKEPFTAYNIVVEKVD